MKTCFHIAGTITPLVLLIPSQWANYAIGREHLLTVSSSSSLLLLLILSQIMYALGNERPRTLLEVEQALWACVLRIVCGSDAETQLKRFLVEYDAMKLAWEAEGVTDLSLGFFDNGKSFYSHFMIFIH